MQHACQVLKEFDLAHESKIITVQRMPDGMFDYAEHARERGLQVIIAGAGAAANLPGLLASKTLIPVLGVPIPTRSGAGRDGAPAPARMARAIPVAMFASGMDGAANAGLFAVALLASADAALAVRLAQYRATQANEAPNMTLPL
jgi:5-(carboxyamino)imidazole ribonucleotide mutase